MVDLTRLSNRPLLDADADASLFVGRQAEVETLDNATRSGLNALVLGAPGSGKTTLLYQAMRRLRQRRQPCVWVDGSLASNVRELLELLLRRVAREPTFPEQWRASVAAARVTSGGLGEVEELAELLTALAPDEQELPFNANRPAIILDGIAAPTVIHTLFGRLRDELWRLPFVWIVSGNERDRLTYLSPPADAFFDVVIGLEPFDGISVKEMLSRRIVDSRYDWLVTDIGQTGPRQPRAAIQLARNAIAHDVPLHELIRKRTTRKESLARLPEAARALVEQLEQYGPSSASDASLLSRLQWSRVRAGQVFRELEQAGLVTASLEPAEGAGRPRKVYALRDDA